MSNTSAVKVNRYPHPDDCGICEAIREGKRMTTGDFYSPYCPQCDAHHYETTPHYFDTLPKHVCQRCRKAQRFLEDIADSGQWSQKKYAPYCEACLVELEWRRMTHTFTTGHRMPDGSIKTQHITAVWWLPPHVVDDMTDEALWKAVTA